MTSSAAYNAQNPYITAYFRQQHSPLIKWNLLLNGLAVAEDIAHLPHLELGFGQGLGLLLSSASQADSSYVGVDFMTAHVDAVKQVREQCQLNIDLYAQDFATFLQTYPQQVQSISLHGVWSWVDPEVRAQLVDIFAKLLAQGGVVYLSHNTLPGRASLMPLQRLLHLTGKEASKNTHHDSLETAFATLGSALSMSQYAQLTPSLITWWQDVQQENPVYLEHEYMSDAWYPMLFSDTAKDLEKAGLIFACSADASESIVDLHLTTEQQAWLNNITNINLRESYQDLLRNTSFRRDIWGKGLMILTTKQQRSLLLDTPMVLIQPIDALPMMLQGDLGIYELSEPVYQQALFALLKAEKMSMTGKALQTAVNDHCKDVSENQIIAVLQHLAAVGYIHPAQSEDAYVCAISASQRLNRHICQQALKNGAIQYLASPLAGCGIQVSRWQQLCLLARFETLSELAEDWVAWLFMQAQLEQMLMSPQGKKVQDKQNATIMAQQFQQQRLPLLFAHSCIV